MEIRNGQRVGQASGPAMRDLGTYLGRWPPSRGGRQGRGVPAVPAGRFVAQVVVDAGRVEARSGLTGCHSAARRRPTAALVSVVIMASESGGDGGGGKSCLPVSEPGTTALAGWHSPRGRARGRTWRRQGSKAVVPWERIWACVAAWRMQRLAGPPLARLRLRSHLICVVRCHCMTGCCWPGTTLCAEERRGPGEAQAKGDHGPRCKHSLLPFRKSNGSCVPSSPQAFPASPRNSVRAWPRFAGQHDDPLEGP